MSEWQSVYFAERFDGSSLMAMKDAINLLKSATIWQ